MALQLNRPGEAHSEFYGRAVDTMPMLTDKGLWPMNMAQVMQRRLDALGDPVEDAWWMNSFHTADIVAYHPSGRIKIVLDSQVLREINDMSAFEYGDLALPDGAYEKLQGEEFRRQDVEKYARGIHLTQNEALNNPFWKAWARDEALLEEYVRAVFSDQRCTFENRMCVSIRDLPRIPTLRLCMLSGLYEGSYAYGGDSPGRDDIRLVGIAQNEMPRNATLENRVASLEYSIPLFERICESAELMNERRIEPLLRERAFWTANFALYVVEKGEPILYFGGMENNPILSNLEEATVLRAGGGSYAPKDTRAIVKSATRVRLSDLDLKVITRRKALFEVPTAAYDDALNPAQRILAERIYGEGDDFAENMRMLDENGISFTIIYLINPEHVRNRHNGLLRHTPPIVVFCTLDKFRQNSYFHADIPYVHYPDHYVRGLIKAE